MNVKTNFESQTLHIHHSTHTSATGFWVEGSNCNAVELDTISQKCQYCKHWVKPRSAPLEECAPLTSLSFTTATVCRPKSKCLNAAARSLAVERSHTACGAEVLCWSASGCVFKNWLNVGAVLKTIMTVLCGLAFILSCSGRRAGLKTAEFVAAALWGRRWHTDLS